MVWGLCFGGFLARNLSGGIIPANYRARNWGKFDHVLHSASMWGYAPNPPLSHQPIHNRLACVE